MNPNSPINWQGQMLGRYRLLRMLGRSGMSEVWLGEDTQLRRQIAIKLLPTVLATNQRYLQDFTHEAQAAAALEHPHILPVHDFGEQQLANGQIVTYLVMPYITGGTLRDRLRATPGLLPLQESLHYLRQAAQAIDYAHGRHVLHRDIKPANMLLQQDWLLLTDFGIAKLLNSDSGNGRTHSGAGTPDYMAPEQIRGYAQPASDCYSLAIVAYQLLTGQLPFRSNSPNETLIKQLQTPPPSTRQFNQHIPSMVEFTLLRALSKRPEVRPASCTAFVEALEQAWNMEQGQQQMQQADPDATVLAPWSRRRQELQNAPTQMQGISAAPQPDQQSSNTYPLGTTMPSTTPMPVGIANTPAMPMYPPTIPAPSQPGWAANTSGSMMLGGVPGQLQGPPTSQTQPPNAGRRKLLIAGAATVAVVATGSIALPLLLHHSTTATTSKATPGPHKLIKGVPLLNLTGHTEAVWNVAWHPSGRYLATAGDDTRVMLWDVASLLKQNSKQLRSISTPLKQWKFADTINSSGICWSADGRYLAVVATGEENKFYVIDTSHNGQPATYTASNLASNINTPMYDYLSVSPKNNLFATSLALQETVTLWQIGHTQAPAKTLSNSALAASMLGLAEVDETAWSMDGSLLAGLTNNNHVLIWQPTSGTIKYTLNAPNRFPKLNSVMILKNAISWSPTNLNQLVASDIDIATVWDIRQKQPSLLLGTDDPNALHGPKSVNGITWVPNITSATWSPNGRYIAGSYGRSLNVHMWDIQTLSKTPSASTIHTENLLFPNSSTLPGHSASIIDVAWSPNGRYLASASFDKTAIIWQVDGA